MNESWTGASRRLAVLIFLVAWFPSSVTAQEILPFEGRVDFSTKNLDLTVKLKDQSSVAVHVQRLSGPGYEFKIDLNHLKTPSFDVVTSVRGTLELPPNSAEMTGPASRTGLTGKISTQQTLINDKFIGELSGRFDISGAQTAVASLFFGNSSCEGKIELRPPYKLDWVFHLSDVDLNDFLDVWDPGRTYECAGLVEGQIKVSGVVGNLVMKGNLKTTNGYVHHLDYQAIVLNAQGPFPKLNITQSMVFQTDGVTYMFDGPIDLGDTSGFQKQLKALTFSPLVSGSDAEREWTIKRFETEGPGTTELKYRFQQRDGLGNSPWESDIDVFTLERTQKF